MLSTAWTFNSTQHSTLLDTAWGTRDRIRLWKTILLRNTGNQGSTTHSCAQPWQVKKYGQEVEKSLNLSVNILFHFPCMLLHRCWTVNLNITRYLLYTLHGNQVSPSLETSGYAGGLTEGGVAPREQWSGGLCGRTAHLQPLHQTTLQRATAGIHGDFLHPSGSIVVRQVVSMDPCFELWIHAPYTGGLSHCVLWDHRKAAKFIDCSGKGSVKVEISTDGNE